MSDLRYAWLQQSGLVDPARVQFGQPEPAPLVEPEGAKVVVGRHQPQLAAGTRHGCFDDARDQTASGAGLSRVVRDDDDRKLRALPVDLVGRDPDHPIVDASDEARQREHVDELAQTRLHPAGHLRIEQRLDGVHRARRQSADARLSARVVSSPSREGTPLEAGLRQPAGRRAMQRCPRSTAPQRWVRATDGSGNSENGGARALRTA